MIAQLTIHLNLMIRNVFLEQMITPLSIPEKLMIRNVKATLRL